LIIENERVMSLSKSYSSQRILAVVSDLKVTTSVA
jgi:hypothetical protein